MPLVPTSSAGRSKWWEAPRMTWGLDGQRHIINKVHDQGTELLVPAFHSKSLSLSVY